MKMCRRADIGTPANASWRATPLPQSMTYAVSFATTTCAGAELALRGRGPPPVPRRISLVPTLYAPSERRNVVTISAERELSRFVYLGDADLRITGHSSSGVRVSAMLQGTTDRGRRVILRGPAVYPGRPFEVFDYRSPSRQEHPVGRAPDARWAPVEDVRIGSVPKRVENPTRIFRSRRSHFCVTRMVSGRLL